MYDLVDLIDRLRDSCFDGLVDVLDEAWDSVQELVQDTRAIALSDFGDGLSRQRDIRCRGVDGCLGGTIWLGKS